jgi:hypothetical protein
MPIKSKLPKPTRKAESIFDAEKRLKEEAKQIAKTFNHIQPIKYLLK